MRLILLHHNGLDLGLSLSRTPGWVIAALIALESILFVIACAGAIRLKKLSRPARIGQRVAATAFVLIAIAAKIIGLYR